MLNFLKVTEKFPSENWNAVGSTVLTGLVVVFIALILLIAAFYLIGLFFAPRKSAKQVKGGGVQAQKENAPPPPEPELAEDTGEDGISGEIIAVISAAIAAYGEADGKQYKIHSVKMAAHATRSPWNAAGLIENMRGF